MKEMIVSEFMALSQREALVRCKQWLEEFNNGHKIIVKDFMKCPMALWVAYNDKKCTGQMVPNTAFCAICGLPMCPTCYNHNVEQLSRVTGYMAPVSGWNAAKKQEFLDRQRHNL